MLSIIYYVRVRGGIPYDHKYDPDVVASMSTVVVAITCPLLINGDLSIQMISFDFLHALFILHIHIFLSKNRCIDRQVTLEADTCSSTPTPTISFKKTK